MFGKQPEDKHDEIGLDSLFIVLNQLLDPDL